MTLTIKRVPVDRSLPISGAVRLPPATDPGRRLSHIAQPLSEGMDP